ncbi:hypothetical protein ATCC90586_008510 [Pythium insidiosum]|nr:hypothetical protein ATCC90586_008510 [Pythium insidiosum]
MPRSARAPSSTTRERRGTPVLEDASSYMRNSSPHANAGALYLMDHADRQQQLPPYANMQEQYVPHHLADTTFDSVSDAGRTFIRNPYNDDGTAQMYRRAPYTPGEFATDSISVAHQMPRMTTPRTAPNNVIRVINKDMTAQFRGRSQSVPNARIRWFENRKSQLLGCCLTMAFLGLTIALYNFRWMGLIAGSVNTIICGTAVVVTYFRKKHWHQHPNPIVHNRAVLGIFLAFCLLLNILVDFKPGDHKSEEMCRGLAGATEFFFFTSEAWGLVMACDLFFSLTSPFTSYKRLMRFYHLWVWFGGIVMACIAWGVAEAGGFFTVDGQSVKYGGDRALLVGFCLAPWILIYSFVIIVLFVSVCVLTLAWHRLYLRGVPKTYNIRLRVLNYVSFFTGAYVFYWLLLLLLYMCAYFVSSKSINSDGTSKGGSEEAVAQVLRQLVAFLIASKGYLDYVIWFAVNSIERPQVNTALRSEILYYTTSGIKESVRAVTDELISIPISGDNDKNKFIKFWSFCTPSFRNIRLTYGISDAEYINMFGATTKERFSEGRSGAFMFFTGDERLIVKTMSPEECNFLRKIAQNYEAYLVANRNTLLTRFYGCHAVSLYGKMYYFVVMANLFADTQECGDGMNFHEPNIVLKDNDLLMKIRIDPVQAHKIYDQIHKDSDFLCEQGIMDYSLLMGVQSSEYYVDTSDIVTSRNMSKGPQEESLFTQVATSGPQEESLFTQVATSVSGPSLYHFGIIDILQQWTFEKKMERFYKVQFKRKDPDGVSAMPPKPYKFRFQQKMSRIFGLASHHRANTPAFHLNHPALIDVLDHDGNRVCAKYYDKSYPGAKDQLALEKKLYMKTKNSNPRLEGEAWPSIAFDVSGVSMQLAAADIILVENIVSVFRSGSDVTMHVVGSANENEIILLSVLDAAFEAVSTLLKGRLDRHVLLDNIELVLLTLDEVVDGGMILETDTSSITNRVLMRGADNEVPISELTISQAFASAREQFSRSFRS